MVETAAKESSTNAVMRALTGMRGLILRRDLLPGEQVRQSDMAKRLKVSRVPVREALKILETEGIVQHHPNSGYFVTKLKADDLRQIYAMRRLLETEVLSSISWPEPADISFFQAINDQLKKAAQENSVESVVELNRLFHFSIFKLSRFTLICKELERLWALSDSYRALYLYSDAARERIVEEHNQIIQLLGARDAVALVIATDQHRSTSEEHVASMLGG